jgi:hypothetical protein
VSEIDLGHVHDYRDKRFIDQCHFTQIAKTCRECGAVHLDTSMRDFRLNPLQVAFARQDCAVCVAMLTAANLTPASWAHV